MPWTAEGRDFSRSLRVCAVPVLSRWVCNAARRVSNADCPEILVLVDGGAWGGLSTCLNNIRRDEMECGERTILL